jgi:hypothetical protein
MHSSELKSKFGKKLLREVSELNSSNINEVIDYIRKDPLAGRLKTPDRGDNAFHILLGSEYDESLILPVLSELCEHSCKGLEVPNINGNLPLHVHLCQRRLSIFAVTMILESKRNYFHALISQ